MASARKPGAKEQLAALEKSLKARGIRFMLPTYVDMHGISKSKMVPIAHFAQMMGGSELFTGAALEGVPQDVSDEEVSSRPDPASCTVLPWQRDVAWFAGNLWSEGKPYEPCSRNILARVTERAAALGYRINVGMEAEFFVFEDRDDELHPISQRPHLEKPAYDTARLLDNLDWMGELVDAMNELGWDVYSFDHEDGIGQFEIDFDYADALTMADRFVFFRWMANVIAGRHGGFASFMPKPMGERAGSGAHYNVSFADPKSGRNLFADSSDRHGLGLSKLGYHYIAGVLAHLPAISAVVAPTVNSYKRLILKGSRSGLTWAPVYVCYGDNNRTNTLRIPLAGGRVELRSADSACNPYLGIAMVAAAGLEGIERELDPGAPHLENMYTKSAAELEAAGVRWLPRTLGAALDAFEADPLSRQVMGDAMFEAWLAYKRDEWLQYNNHVTDWEMSRYLRQFG